MIHSEGLETTGESVTPIDTGLLCGTVDPTMEDRCQFDGFNEVDFMDRSSDEEEALDMNQ